MKSRGAFSERHLLPTPPTESVPGGPVHRPLSVEEALHRLRREPALAADLAPRAGDEAAQPLWLEGPGRRAIRLIPATALSGRGVVATLRTAVTLGANLKVDQALPHRQRAPPQRPVMAGGAPGSPAPSVGSGSSPGGSPR
jgi:hypothetical protein